MVNSSRFLQELWRWENGATDILITIVIERALCLLERGQLTAEPGNRRRRPFLLHRQHRLIRDHAPHDDALHAFMSLNTRLDELITQVHYVYHLCMYMGRRYNTSITDFHHKGAGLVGGSHRGRLVTNWWWPDCGSRTKVSGCDFYDSFGFSGFITFSSCLLALVVA